MRIVVSALSCLLMVLAFASGAWAHFSQGAKLRTIIVAEEEGGLVALARVPAPLIFSDVVREAQISAVPLATPFLYLEETGAGPRYRISLQAIAADQARFEERLRSSLAWQQNGLDLTAGLIGYRLIGREPGEPFGTIADARRSLNAEGARIDPVFGAAIVEIALSIEAPTPGADLVVGSALPELELPAGVSIDNHLVDARVSPPVSYMQPGQLIEPVELDGSLLSSLVGFVWQGVVHILVGLDHVFLVICLALGMGATLRLVWLVTAFTLGHSVTLVATFLGAAPAWPWFIPAVEAAIAASVIYAGIAALLGRIGSPWIVAAIGLLHGLGFSFVLGDILGRDAPNLVAALAAFNVGIEIGQVAILAATLAALALITRLSAEVVTPLRVATLGLISVVAGYWLVERSLSLV